MIGLRQKREVLQKQKEELLRMARNIQKKMNKNDWDLFCVQGEIQSLEEREEAVPPEAEAGEAGFEEQGVHPKDEEWGVPEMNSPMQWHDHPEDEEGDDPEMKLPTQCWLDEEPPEAKTSPQKKKKAQKMPKRRQSKEEEVVGGEELVEEEAVVVEDEWMEDLRRVCVSDEEEEQVEERGVSQSDCEEGDKHLEENQQEEEDLPEEEEQWPWRKRADDGRIIGWKSRMRGEDVMEEGQELAREQTEAMHYATKWLQQGGDDKDIPQNFTPCKFYFKSRGCRNTKCLFSHNEEIFGREPFVSFIFEWKWEGKERKTWYEINGWTKLEQRRGE